MQQSPQTPYFQAAISNLSLLDEKSTAKFAVDLLKTIPHHPGESYLLGYAMNYLDKINLENIVYFLKSNYKNPRYEYYVDSFLYKIKTLSVETRKDIKKSVLAIQSEQHKNRTYSIPDSESDRFFKRILDALGDIES